MIILILALIAQLVCSKHKLVGSENNQNDLSKLPLRKFSTRKDSSETLYVHLIAHSHDDVGWLKTVDGYFYGTEQKYPYSSVYLIISEVVISLQQNKQRKFSQCEIKYFSMWYEQQSEETKEIVRNLVKEGRLEFINGGWSMHDEAVTHYEDMINNMMLGHEYLLKEFGIKPKIGWQIDPFGHSSANPRLFADMGIEAWFFSRLDAENLNQRSIDQSLNFIWRPFSKHFGNQKQIFTSIMRDQYNWPGGFFYDQIYYGDSPFIIDKKSREFNADEKSEDLLNYIIWYAESYQGNHILIPYGTDFSYSNAEQVFINTDNIIRYFNENNDQNIKLLYSTPSQYLEEIYKQDIAWPVNYFDMLPYSDNPQNYWTGFYISRQALKKQVRDGQANLHSSNFLYSQKVVDSSTSDIEIQKIMEAKQQMLDTMGILQHHDAVTGTSQQHVADDYSYRIFSSMNMNNQQYTKFLKQELKIQTGIDTVNLEKCICSQNDTAMDCPISQHPDKNEIIAVIHNTQQSKFTQLVRIQVPHQNFQVSIWNTSKREFIQIKIDVVPQMHRHNNGTQVTDYDIYFPYHLQASQVGFVKLLQNGKEQIIQQDQEIQINENEKASLKLVNTNETIPIQFEYQVNYTKNNQISTMIQKFGISMGIYLSSNGSDGYPSTDNNPEGAYILKIDKSKRYQLPFGRDNFKLLEHFKSGKYIEQLTFQFQTNCSSNASNSSSQSNIKSDKICQYALLKVQFSAYNDNLIQTILELNEVEVYSEMQGKNIVVNWHFDDFEANKTFWTDSNGLEMQKRILNHRDTFQYRTLHNISSNYYPIVSAIAIRDFSQNKQNSVQATLMTERSMGGSADLIKGTIEIIQNRRLLLDDGRGVLEPLNETDKDGYGIKTNARYYLDIFDRKNGQSKQRKQQAIIDLPIQIFFSFDFEQKSLDLQKSQNQQIGSLNSNLKILAFPLGRNKVMFRIENTDDLYDFELEKPNYKQFNFIEYLTNFYQEANKYNIQLQDKLTFEIKEYSLSNNMPQSEMEDRKRTKQWKVKDDDEIQKTLWSDSSQLQAPSEQNGYSSLIFEPQRIRQFQVLFSLNSNQFIQ